MNAEQARDEMVRTQLERRGITDRRVLDAMLQVPRHHFVPDEARDQAYADHALPIDEGQTISQPFIVAFMAQALQLRGDERILEIGTGTGYSAAVLSLLAGEVYTVERSPQLALTAENRLHDLGYQHIHVFHSDGTDGLPAYAPFDAITVTAAAPWIPRPLREQLGNEGRLVIPIGGQNEQILLRFSRQQGESRVERLLSVRFVPLLGAHSWPEQAS